MMDKERNDHLCVDYAEWDLTRVVRVKWVVYKMSKFFGYTNTSESVLHSLTHLCGYLVPTSRPSLLGPHGL